MAEKIHALKEIQSLFRRQRKVNAIDVFLALGINGNKKVYPGKHIEEQVPFIVRKPGNVLFSDRYFTGSEISFEMAKHFNFEYYIIAISIQMLNLSKFFTGKEIVRGFIKNYIKVSAKYINNHSEDTNITKDNLIFREKYDFYTKVFTPQNIIKEMRRKGINRLKNITNNKNNNFDENLEDTQFLQDYFIRICCENGLNILKPIIEEIVNMANDVQKRQIIIGIIKFISLYSRLSNKKFHKALKNLFEANEDE